MAFTVILFWVSVPVLSEQITEAEPSVSTAGRLRIMALRLTIRLTPSASTTVTIAGSPSGIAATAKATEVINNVKMRLKKLVPSAAGSKSPIINTIAQIISTPMPINLPSDASFCFKGVIPLSASSKSVAILPTSEFMPVSVTTAVPRP